jgi:hypothetical protein
MQVSMMASGDITKTRHWTNRGSLPSQIHQWHPSGVYVLQGPNEQQGFQVPAKELDKALGYEKHYVCIVLTHHGQVLVCEMNVFR